MDKIRKTRKSHINYYLASSIVCKDNGQGIYGFRLYDLQYGDYEIFTLKGVQAILKKYSDAIVNVKVRNGYLGFCYIGSNNYSVYNRHGDIVKNGNKIFVGREGINRYLILNEEGKVVETDIRGIKDWVSHDVLLDENKDAIARELKRDIEFFNKDFDKFSRREELLVITGNNYLETKVLSLPNGERAIRVCGIKTESEIPEGIVRIPKEVAVVDLDISDLDSVKVIDLRQAHNLRHLNLDINKCNLSIIFPNFMISKVKLLIQESTVQFQNIGNTYFLSLEMHNVNLENKSLWVKILGGNESYFNWDKVYGIEELKLSGAIDKEHKIHENKVKISSCEDLVYLDAEELNLTNLSSDTVRNMPKLKKCRLRLDNGTIYVACNRCLKLEELELYGTISVLSTMSLTYNTPWLRKLVLNTKINITRENAHFLDGEYILEEIVNNSNVSTDKLFSRDYLEVCKVCKNNERLKLAFKRMRLEPVWSNGDILGFKMTYYLGFNNNDTDEYTKLLKQGILDIPKEVLAIDSRVFKNTPKITKVIFNGPIELRDEVFKDCTKLTCVENSEYIYKMGDGVFAYDYNLKEFRCGNELKKINKSTFLMCKGLKNLYVSDSVEEFGDYSLFCCTSLKLEGNMNFKFTERTVLNKNYVFKLNNSEVAQLALDISNTDWITLKEVVEFKEIKLLRDILNNYGCNDRIQDKYNKTGDVNLEKLLKLIAGMYNFDMKNLSNVKINMTHEIKIGGNSVKENYLYIMLAKQTNMVVKKLQASGLMDYIENILKK